MSSSPTLSSSTETARPIEANDATTALQDIRCHVDVIIGTGVLTLRDCLTLQRQHVLKLVEPAGGDLSIRVHGITLATGEVVVVDNAAALRVTHIVPPAGVEVS